MTQNGKAAAGVAVVLILAVGTGYLLMHSQIPGSAMQETAGASNAGAVPLPSGTATSDAALSKDTAAIDAQMNTLSADSAAVDQGVNAQQTP